jgi:spore coat polysaccharide biosynthesis protein SpsF
MIVRQLERTARASTLDRIVVATSTDPGDDQVADVLTGAGIEVIRGPLEDVLARYQQAIETYRPDVLVRMTADCPLISPAIIDHVVQTFHASDADYVANTMQPTYPDGQDVEVVTADALQEASATFTDPHECEHVTLGIYRRPEHFAIENVIDPTGRDNSKPSTRTSMPATRLSSTTTSSPSWRIGPKLLARKPTPRVMPRSMDWIPG